MVERKVYKLLKKWKNAKIRTQIILTYIAVLLLSFIMTFTLISAVNGRYTKIEVGKAGVQTVNALQGNLALIFDNVTQFSTQIYFDDIVQDSLRQINSENINLNYQKNITKSLFNMILSGEYIPEYIYLINIIIVIILIRDHQKK